MLAAKQIVTPQEARRADLLVTHSHRYLQSLNVRMLRPIHCTCEWVSLLCTVAPPSLILYNIDCTHHTHIHPSHTQHTYTHTHLHTCTRHLHVPFTHLHMHTHTIPFTPTHIFTDSCAFMQRSYNVAMVVEVPPVAILPNSVVHSRLLRPFRIQTGGTILVS